jgi:hypothetical protein
MPQAYGGGENHHPHCNFRLPEILDTSYRRTVSTQSEVRIAGVPWPLYKLVSLGVGAVVLILVGAITMTAGHAVVAASAAATAVWLGTAVVRALHR